MGVWLRVKAGKHCARAVAAGSILWNFALGMQSLRQTLVLCLPLFALDVSLALYARLKRRETFSALLREKSLRYSLVLLIANLAGTALMRMLHVPQYSILAAPEMDAASNISTALFAFLHLALRDSHYPVLVRAASVFIAACVALAAGMIVKKRDGGPLVFGILFSVISLAAVLFAGILVIRVREIYYFVWFLLAALSCVYLAMNLRINAVRIGALLICAAALVSYRYNFVSDFYEAGNREIQTGEVGAYLLSEGVDTVYIDNLTGFQCKGAFASLGSEEELNVVGFVFDPHAGNADAMLKRMEYVQKNDLWPADGERYVLLSTCTWDSIQAYSDEEALESLQEELELVKQFPCAGNVLYLYRTEVGFSQAYQPS